MAQDWGAHLGSARAALLRHARAQLRNDDWAADAVGSVMLAALERPPPFADPGRVRAWLFGMLRHKLVDVLREQAPQRVHLYGLDPEVVDATESHTAGGDQDPERRLAGHRFLQDLARALEQLPPLHRRAFVLREVLGEETAQTCSELGISDNHLAVCLHRARARLRQLLVAHST